MRKQRLRDLPAQDRVAALDLSEADIAAVRAGLPLALADRMIENAVGAFALPLGIAENFLVNGRDVLVPMAIEEPSVVAACSFAAKLARAGGGFHATSSPPIMIGQVQILDVADPVAAAGRIAAESGALIAWLNTGNPATQSRHVTAVGLETRVVPLDAGRPAMLVAHVLYDCGDAMGANLVNTACEALAPRLAALSGGRVNLRILSNYSDRRTAAAECTIPAAALDLRGEDAEGVLAARIEEASLFAEFDPYRAVTHNKGVMNGIDAVLVATGNDWRAVEAAAHAWAARDGHYGALTRWRRTADGGLHGEIALPLAVGIVGGATRVHPVAGVALRILGVRSARELAEIAACVGLAQNLAALRALAAEGIQRGHMGLHARQIAIAAGAQGADIDGIAAQMAREGNIRLDRARELAQRNRPGGLADRAMEAGDGI